MTDLVVRPRRLVKTAWVMAAVLFGFFALMGAALRGAPPGPMQFQLVDQIALTLFGLLLAAVVLLFTRPRLVADDVGVRVRNALRETSLPWGVVREVRFREGEPWATLALHDDETLAVLAIQANDGDYARQAVTELRRRLERGQQ